MPIIPKIFGSLRSHRLNHQIIFPLASLAFTFKTMVYSYPTLNTFTYYMYQLIILYVLYTTHISIQIYGQPTLLWHKLMSKHMYPLQLPKIEPFCMKITKNISGRGPPYPLQSQFLFHTIIYMHMHIPIVCKSI